MSKKLSDGFKDAIQAGITMTPSPISTKGSTKTYAHLDALRDELCSLKNTISDSLGPFLVPDSTDSMSEKDNMQEEFIEELEEFSEYFQTLLIIINHCRFVATEIKSLIDRFDGD